MDTSQIPDFLLTNVSRSSQDRKVFLLDLQLWVLWREVYGSKPYNHAGAIQLQRRLGAQYEAVRAKEAQKQAKLRDERARVYAELTTKIAEFCFKVQASGWDVKNAGEVGWREPIVDEHEHKKWGSPFELFNNACDGAVSLGWGNLRADARNDLSAYLVELKERYDGFEYEFVFFRERKRSLVMVVQRAPFPPEIPRIFRFTLKLTYQPFGADEIAQKVKKSLEKSRATSR